MEQSEDFLLLNPVISLNYFLYFSSEMKFTFISARICQLTNQVWRCWWTGLSITRPGSADVVDGQGGRTVLRFCSNWWKNQSFYNDRSLSIIEHIICLYQIVYVCIWSYHTVFTIFIKSRSLFKYSYKIYVIFRYCRTQKIKKKLLPKLV